MIIDLRSDTVTRPSKGMKEAMMNAILGDDVFSECPTVMALEEKTAKMFGQEAGLFCPSGTMTNQIAIKAHTQPLDEVIMDKLAHIYLYELGGYSYHSGVAIKLLDGDRGRFIPNDFVPYIQGANDWEPNTKMVCIENTVNKGGGCFYTFDEMKNLRDACAENGLIYHLDGARVFNALTEIKESSEEVGALFDSVSICLSKGLGAPVGSVLVGKKDVIKKSRKIRKVMGGGMRQAGILAAAGIYALDNNVSKLKNDHLRAKTISQVLEKLPYIEEVLPVETNILIFKVNDAMANNVFTNKLAENNIKAIEFGHGWVRFVTHLDFTDSMMEKVVEVMKGFV